MAPTDVADEFAGALVEDGVAQSGGAGDVFGGEAFGSERSVRCCSGLGCAGVDQVGDAITVGAGAFEVAVDPF